MKLALEDEVKLQRREIVFRFVPLDGLKVEDHAALPLRLGDLRPLLHGLRLLLGFLFCLLLGQISCLEFLQELSNRGRGEFILRTETSGLMQR